MTLFEITHDIDLKRRWKPQPQEYYFLAANGNSIRPEDQKLIKSHVKHVREPKTVYDRFVVRYNPEWYDHTKIDPRVRDFDDLLKIVKRYFTLGTVKSASKR
jgi:hypothetical protein